jgi:hypothetical protein
MAGANDLPPRLTLMAQRICLTVCAGKTVRDPLICRQGAAVCRYAIGIAVGVRPGKASLELCPVSENRFFEKGVRQQMRTG